jgi:formate dehydrogenase (coenzyme F420) beta subunit
MTSKIEEKLRRTARELLEQGKVVTLVGYEAGSLKFTTTPLITKDKEATGRLVINPFIINNLSVFLKEIGGKVGIVAKGCDSRSIVSLIQDKQLARENVFIIGVSCAGIIDLDKIEKLTGKDRDEIDDISREGDKVIVTINGERKDFAAKDVLIDSCLGCDRPVPKEYDVLLEEDGAAIIDSEATRSLIKKLEAMPPAQRWEFWKNQFDHCIRCYACRQVCPACFCKRCFVEETEPQWISPLPKWQDNLIFQVTRMMHVAGRCTDCGACERACPVGIPLHSLSRKMEEIVQELFEYKAGADKDAQPLMAAYESKEAEDLIR